MLLWTAILIFAAANSVIRRLTELGAVNLVDGRNAISFCNVLFVGNVCALFGLLAVHYKHWNRTQLAALTRSDWLSLVVLALLSSALAPALTFVALERTTVTNVILLGRVEPPLLLVLSALILKERIDKWTALGAGLSLAGVVLMLVLGGSAGDLMIGPGEAYAAFGAATLAVSTVLSKTRLHRIPLGIFTVFRTGLGVIIFFWVATYLYGVEHFQDALSPFLWQWMVVYGLVIVVGGQLCWFGGLKATSGTDVSLATSCSPIAGVAFALLLLGEQPGLPQIVGGLVILLGVAVAQVGPRVQSWSGVRAEPTETLEADRDSRVGFRGV